MNQKTNKINIGDDYVDIKAVYSRKPQRLVYASSLRILDEIKINYEIGFGIGFVLLGIILKEYNLILLISCLAFMVYSIANLIRYFIKRNRIMSGND